MNFQSLVNYLLSQQGNFESLARLGAGLKRKEPEAAEYILGYAKSKYPKDYVNGIPALQKNQIPVDASIIKKEHIFEVLYTLVVKQLDLEQLKEIHTNLKKSNGKAEKALRKYIEFQVSVGYSIDLSEK